MFGCRESGGLYRFTAEVASAALSSRQADRDGLRHDTWTQRSPNRCSTTAVSRKRVTSRRLSSRLPVAVARVASAVRQRHSCIPG
jgi:hypothetical protein